MVNCERGTRSQPCNNTSHDPFLDERDATSVEIRAAHEGRHPIITPSSIERPRPHRQSGNKPKGVLDYIDRLFGLKVRTSPKKGREKEPQRFFVRNKQRRPRAPGGRAEDRQPVPVHPPPRAPTPPVYHPPPPPVPPVLPTTPIIVPIEPPQEHRSRRQEYHPAGQRPPPRQRPPPQQRPLPRQRPPSQEREMEREPRRRGRQPPMVHQSSSEEYSPSPPTASRRHQRRTRSLSPRSKYEEEKRAIRERERQQHLARAARLEQEAHERAVRLAEDERRNRQREERQRRLEESEERRRIESAERARRRQQREEEERYQRRRDEARGRQEEADRERLRQQHDRMAEQERLERLRRANIPRQPRHQPTVHEESLADRGDRFVREAIRGENARQWARERQMPPAYDGGFLGRRNTIDAGQRRRRGWEGPWW